MASHLYIFRITINSKKRLSINIEEPTGSRQFSVDFGYNDELVNRITQFQLKARQKHPVDLSSDDIRELGEHLFEAIFDKQLQAEFEHLYKKVLADDDLLRIELDIDEEYLPQVAAFPWEFMRPPKGTALLLSASPHLILSRRPRLHIAAPRLQLEKDDKIRILLVVSYPGSRADAELGAVVYQPILDALNEMADAGNSSIELIFTDNAQPKELDHLLKAHKPHVFHFIGHGRLHQVEQTGEERGQLALAPEDDLFGEAQWVDADYFSRLFSENHPAPSLVLLQACEGARLSESRAFASVTSRIVQQNIPAVVGMQYVVSNDTAVGFIETFYRELAQDAPLDVAVQAARHAITMRDYRDEARDFATPVLFMRLPDGRLFQRKQLAIQARRRRAAVDNSKELRRALTRLNFRDHRYKFGDIYGKTNKMGAFLISGPEFSGHQWLRNLLLKEEFKDELGDGGDIHPLHIDIGTAVYTQRIDDLWDYFAFLLTGEHQFGVSQKDIATLLLDRWRAGHTVIVLDNACKRGATYPKDVMQQFWQPLIQTLQSILKAENKPAPNHWFLLFLLDTQGQLGEWQNDGLDRADPANPIVLPNLSSHFPQGELEAWWQHGHTRLALAPALNIPQFDTLEKLRQFVWQRSDNGKVIPLFDLVCRVCQVDWKEIEGS
ncbi:MAG: CHAT domain-containing protein [Ardenticatenaceae bacterium]|nr:CHAT domain-containing protein [Ardenticatenaceae bacterium]